MKSNLASGFGSVRSFLLRAKICTLLVCSSSFLLAQNPQADAPADSETAASANAEVSAEDSAAQEDAVPERVNLADLVTAAPATPVPTAPPVPAHIPAVVAAYLPVQDTNVGIGIGYSPGDPHFVYLVAGIRPPGGDPRLPPETPAPAVQIVAPSAPLVYYERPEWGSRAVAMRTTEADQVQTFPPGAFVKRPAGFVPPDPAISSKDPLPRRALYFRQATTDETGKDLVWNFPPGATLVRNTPAPTGR